MKKTKPLELQFKPVREFGEKWRVFSGKYLTCSLFVVAVLPAPQGRTGPFCERFILDTGSAVTFIREATLSRVFDVSFGEIGLEEQVFGNRLAADGSPERAKIIPRLEFPSLGVRLSRAFARSMDEPFGLLGTDFLEMFRMEFDPRDQRAVLTLLDG